MTPDYYTSIIGAMFLHARHKPHEIAFKFYHQGELESLTWQELCLRSTTLAAALLTHARPGDRALLVYPQGLEFVSAFLACAMTGVIAIPCFPPNTASLREKLTAIIADAQPILALCDKNAQEIDDIVLLDTTNIPNDTETLSNFSPYALKGSDIAFLQYSSGSTGEPKGVVVSHANIVANVKCILKAGGFSKNTRGLCWMPHTHDMGLVGHILVTIYVGSYLCLVPPSQMVRHPFSILMLLKEERLDSLGMPNFACELCIKRIKPEQLAQLDLSQLKTVIVGAEPINAEVLKEFSQKFSSAGFKPEMFLCSYGLAETTLMASASRGYGVNKVQNGIIVNCGAAVESVKIVHPETLIECAEGESGEIWLSGESIAQGYWNKPELSRKIFHAQLQNETKNYLRTGDLGCLLDGNLYVHGRLKEMMIFSGEKHFPQDIEATILASNEQLTQQDCVVFSTEGKNTEQLVAIIKIARNINAEIQKSVENQIRKSVLQRHQLVINDAIFVANTIPRTTSGKKQRVHCKKLYEAQQLEKHFQLMTTQEEVYATATN